MSKLEAGEFVTVENLHALPHGKVMKVSRVLGFGNVELEYLSGESAGEYSENDLRKVIPPANPALVECEYCEGRGRIGARPCLECRCTGQAVRVVEVEDPPETLRVVPWLIDIEEHGPINEVSWSSRPERKSK